MQVGHGGDPEIEWISKINKVDMIDSNLWVRLVPQTVTFIPHISKYYIKWHVIFQKAPIKTQNESFFWEKFWKLWARVLSRQPSTWAEEQTTLEQFASLHLALHSSTDPWVCNLQVPHSWVWNLWARGQSSVREQGKVRDRAAAMLGGGIENESQKFCIPYTNVVWSHDCTV